MAQLETVYDGCEVNPTTNSWIHGTNFGKTTNDQSPCRLFRLLVDCLHL